MTIGANLRTEKARRATRERMWTVARRRYQSGCLFKRGKRRKVWIARWREDVILPDGGLGRIQRSIVIGLVSEVPTRRQAQTQLDQHLQMLNQGVTDRTVFPRSYQTIFQSLSQIRFPPGQPTVAVEHARVG